MATGRRSPLGLVILGMLGEAPMHAYRMQKLIRDRGKDTVVNVRQRTSVHQTLDRLLRLGLIRIVKTPKSARHRERVVYAITPLGGRTAKEWMCSMLSTVGGEFPEFPAAVSMIPVLSPAEARRQLDIRAGNVRSALSQLDAVRQSLPGLPRLFLLEDEYQVALLEAELAWLTGVIADLASGALAWDAAWLRKIAAEFERPDTEQRDTEQPARTRRPRTSR